MVNSSDLRFLGEGIVAAGDCVPLSGELAVFCRPVVTAPAVIRRDGIVLAGAWLPDLVRLGELERHLGDGVIEAVMDAAVAAGRIMSYPLVVRLMIAMTLMPDASYCEALRRVAGLLADIPFAREWHVPTEKVITSWRLPVPPRLMEDLFWRAAGPLIADDGPPAALLAGMMVLAADGMLVKLADTPANRKAFGSAGTADGSAPFPHLRVVTLTARAGRASICMPSRTGSALLAADTVTVAVESVNVSSDHLDGPLNVSGAIAAAACAVDIASDRHTGTAVVRVALLGFLYSHGDDPGDRRPDDYLPYQFFVCLDPVEERHLIGEDLRPLAARVSHPGGALRKCGIIHSHRLERNSPPVGDGTFLDYWRGLRRGA